MNGLSMKTRKKLKKKKSHENEHTRTQKLWDTAKAALRGKFKALQAYLKGKKHTQKSQINNLIFHLKEQEKE